MWMGPEACVKHDLHPLPPRDKERLDLLWNFFDNLCSKKEGCQGSWNAARMTLKFMKQDKGESVDIFYGGIRDVLHQCEYDPTIQKVLEAETLKYDLTKTKIIEKDYALQKDVDASRVLDIARAEEQAQTYIREVQRLGGTTTWGKLKAQRSSDNKRSPSAKIPRLPVIDKPKTSTTAKDADANMVPNSALPMGKNAVNASCVLDIARAEEQAQTHIREVQKIRRDYNLGEKEERCKEDDMHGLWIG